MLPLEDQFYSGFYNKALLQKAGLDGPPQDWSELYAACTKLRAAGVEPMLYGSDSQALSSEFYPFYDLSYLMTGAYSYCVINSLYESARCVYELEIH